MDGDDEDLPAENQWLKQERKQNLNQIKSTRREIVRRAGDIPAREEDQHPSLAPPKRRRRMKTVDILLDGG